MPGKSYRGREANNPFFIIDELKNNHNVGSYSILTNEVFLTDQMIGGTDKGLRSAAPASPSNG